MNTCSLYLGYLHECSFKNDLLTNYLVILNLSIICNLFFDFRVVIFIAQITMLFSNSQRNYFTRISNVYNLTLVDMCVTSRDVTGPEYSRPDRTGPAQTGPDRTGPDRRPAWTGPDRHGPDWTGTGIPAFNSVSTTGIDRATGSFDELAYRA